MLVGASTALTAVLPFGGDGCTDRSPRLQPASAVATSKYISYFRRRLAYVRVCCPACDFTARWFALFAVADQRLTEQRRNRPDVGEDDVLVLVGI
jgi:hypothetical protein